MLPCMFELVTKTDLSPLGFLGNALCDAVKTSSVNKKEKQELHLWKSWRIYSNFNLDHSKYKKWEVLIHFSGDMQQQQQGNCVKSSWISKLVSRFCSL